MRHGFVHPSRRRRWVQGMALLLPLGLATCAGEIRPGAGAPANASARVLYENRCGRCHEPFPAHAYPAESWRGIILRMGPKAGLTGAEEARIVNWLEQRAQGGGSR